MAKIMDVQNSSKEFGGYLKKLKDINIVQTPRNIQPRFSLAMAEQYQRTIEASRYLCIARKKSIGGFAKIAI